MYLRALSSFIFFPLVKCLCFSQAIHLASEMLQKVQFQFLFSLFRFQLIIKRFSKFCHPVPSVQLFLPQLQVLADSPREPRAEVCTRWIHKPWNATSNPDQKLISWVERGFFSCSNYALLETNASSSCRILYNATILWESFRNSSSTEFFQKIY